MGVTFCVAPTFLLAEFRPAGRVPFWITRKEPKSDWGPLPVSTLPAAMLTVIAPRPPATGMGHFRPAVTSGGQNQDLFPSYSRALGPFAIKICEGLLLSYTAWCVPTCLVRRWSGGPAATVLPEQAVSVQRSGFLIFDAVGASAPEARRKQGLVLGRRKVTEISLEGVPRNRGSRGCGDYEHPPVARCSSEPHPLVPFWCLFGSFLGKQKGTPASPIKKINPFPLTATQKTDKIFWQIRKTAWRRKSTRL